MQLMPKSSTPRGRRRRRSDDDVGGGDFEVLSVEATAVEAVMEQRVMHLKGNGETTLVAQADGPNLLATLARTYTEA